ncbi:GntR family transcriptional regulator (plasmid) [Streptoverticillium reticulum]|uniref:GntR family transcriptional regulator n=1 Tax=Streptoverticillium reticulum TaxID=1433415 RepID=UPI0039BF3780
MKPTTGSSVMRRIADDVREKVRAGVYKPEDKLPTSKALAAEYEVTAKTVERAYDLLKETGDIVGRRGAGMFVAPRPPAIHRHSDRHQTEKDRVHLTDQERSTWGAAEATTKLPTDAFRFEAEFSNVLADEKLAEIFGIDVGARLLRRDFRSYAGGSSIPQGLTTSFLPYDIPSRNPELFDSSREPWPGGTQHQLSTVGVEVVEVTEDIAARDADPDEAEELGLPERSTVMVIEKTTVGLESDGGRRRVVDYSVVLLPAARTRLTYRIPLAPWSS